MKKLSIKEKIDQRLDALFTGTWPDNQEIKNLVYDIAREQYMNGSRDGIQYERDRIEQKCEECQSSPCKNF